MGFFDILYLGVFIILSPALDERFYRTAKPPPTLVEEVTYALRHFHSLLHIFSDRFLIVLEGEPISHAYVVDRMLGEFAAAAVVFSKAIPGLDDCNGDGNGEDEITSSCFMEHINSILHQSYPMAFPYYSRCLESGHKHFVWTGPELQIIPRSEGLDAIMPLLTLGELNDLPTHKIYDQMPKTEVPSSIPPAEKRHGRGDSSDLASEHPKKRRR